jgi:hypothetical protein
LFINRLLAVQPFVPQRRKFRAHLASVGPTDACAISKQLSRTHLA